MPCQIDKHPPAPKKSLRPARGKRSTVEGIVLTPLPERSPSLAAIRLARLSRRYIFRHAGVMRAAFPMAPSPRRAAVESSRRGHASAEHHRAPRKKHGELRFLLLLRTTPHIQTTPTTPQPYRNYIATTSQLHQPSHHNYATTTPAFTSDLHQPSTTIYYPSLRKAQRRRWSQIPPACGFPHTCAMEAYD